MSVISLQAGVGAYVFERRSGDEQAGAGHHRGHESGGAGGDATPSRPAARRPGGASGAHGDPGRGLRG
ncbi:hypothetical protein [Streptomyces sp. ISL-66]|uniref:hypothetical protein n=1 Tax=Streptomyces sp. ISL-66 TaxID=2819186 RepID=UPI002035B0CD|nr:hypothetical protein [Streptomyces sp. ISL-66]